MLQAALLASLLILPFPSVPAEVGTGDIFLAAPEKSGRTVTGAEFLDIQYAPVRLSDGGLFFLLGVDLDTKEGTYPLTFLFESPPKRVSADVKVVSRDFPVEELTLPEGMVTPPPEVLERIGLERKAAAEVYRSTSAANLWEPPFAKPVDGNPSGNFGRRRILNGIPKSPHSGEDYSSPQGTEVRAAARGKVRMARDLYYSGKTILIDHGAGMVSQYFHLDEMEVSSGQLVERGDPIGRVGSTGRVTGPHLHFGIRLYGQRVDPSMPWKLFPPGKKP